MKTLLALILTVLLLAALNSRATIESFTLSLLFTDSMVMQRNTAVPVWGTAGAGASVTVRLNEDAQDVTAGADGTWRAVLEPHPAGGPHMLTVTSGSQSHVVNDIWFGDIWIASGQSNMEWTVAMSNDAESEIRSANDSLIRHFKVPRTWSYEPESMLAGGEWHPAVPEHVGAFTAVGYYFARALRTSVGVPIGIVNTSWGGSRIEAWMHPDALGSEFGLADRLTAHRLEIDSLRQRLRRHGASETEDSGLNDGVAVWADPELDTSAWESITVPSGWESAGFPGLDGVGWYRIAVDLAEEQVGKGDAALHLDRIDDNDMTWVNGHLVGQTTGVRDVRTYTVPAGVLRAGPNVIVVRVTDTGGRGGIYGDADALRLVTSSATVTLDGSWTFRVGMVSINQAAGVNQLPTLLYNKMVNPILNFPITGFLWYQGESNGGNPDDAARYAAQFQSLITSWREAFGAPEAPFLFVSLANFRAAEPEPGESNWAILRESQSAAVTGLDGVAQAITIDIGEADDIHPRNKQDVGSRLALAARNLAYDEDLVHSGPVYREHTVSGARVIIHFDHVGSGLVARGSELGGFAVAGLDGPFVWADARIDKNTVIVSSPVVSKPVDVRYAWADNPSNASLYNKEGLPAVPFRTNR